MNARPPSRFLAAVQAHIRSRAADIALVWYRDGKTPPLEITWGELHHRALELESELAPLLAPASMVAIVGGSSPTLVATLLAALNLGATPTLFPPPSPRQDGAYFFEQQSRAMSALRPSALICIDVQYNAPQPAPLYVELHNGQIIKVAHADVAAAPLPDETLFVQHSSGTTGVKKGIPFTDACLVEQLERYCAAFDFSSEQTSHPAIGTWLPFYHDMGFVANLLLSLYKGARLVFTDAFAWTDYPPLLFKMIAEQRVEHVWMPNFAFRHMTRFFQPGACPHDLSSVRNWINCSETCSPGVMADFCKHFATNGVSANTIKCCYAMAEAVFAVTQTRAGAGSLRIADAAPNIGATPVVVESGGAEIASNGPPLRGVDIRTAQDDRFLPAGQVGEICVRAPYMFSGYIGLDNSRLFLDGYYHSGDVGFMHDGELYVLGRIKDLLIINGRNFLAHEIEACVHGIAGVRQGRAVALGVYSDALGSEELVIVAEADCPTTAIEAGIREAVSTEFGLTARHVKLVEERWIVKSSSGKISRRANLEKYQSRLSHENGKQDG